MITNIMSDGSINTDLTGYVIKKEGNEGLYDLVQTCAERGNDELSDDLV